MTEDNLEKLPDYTTPEDFFFKTPPYDQLEISDAQVHDLFVEPLTLDGFCPYCNQSRTFSRSKGERSNNWYVHHKVHGYLGDIVLQCTRYEEHTLRFHVRMSDDTIYKSGQDPSFADIAIDESKDYSKLLTRADAAEFHRAIGLAAHNVGIGSYVYLRRIFERLVFKRFEDFKLEAGWKDEDFYGVRMDDRVRLLKDHLPSFLVKNARIYSILSLGIHELDEKQCLQFFPVLRQSLILILEQDKKLKEELELQKQLEKSIAAFEPPKKLAPPATPLSLADLGNHLEARQGKNES